MNNHSLLRFISDHEAEDESRLRCLPRRQLRIPRPTGRKYVREIRQGLYQARPFINVRWWWSINLGLYKSARDAAAAVSRWISAGCHPCRGLPDGILPKYVRIVDGGYQGRVKIKGVVFRTDVMESSEMAFYRMTEILEAQFPKKKTSRKKKTPRSHQPCLF